jgi:hypothetical protein
MARTVKKAGQMSSKARGRTSHGSPHEATYNRLEGRAAHQDKKPNGFLSRHGKPSTGRRRSGPA